MTDYIGRGELVARWGKYDYAVTRLHRNNLSLNPNRGFAQLDVTVPWLSQAFGIHGIQLHFQATTGYGQSLLDYNHRQTTFGAGLAFGDIWE